MPSDTTDHTYAGGGCLFSSSGHQAQNVQMQQQELAQMRQRDANLTALAAIGPRKKRKLDSPGAAAAGVEVSGSSSGSPSGSAASSSRQYSRQRITRVNLRDFIFYMEEERETSHSLLLYRALLK
ncbi:Transcription initiation factor TFIID subunit 4 [Acipenser ruthenus]|uniref:Transcription initiation factor TFIID subunit 4 n=1 Tax=Acipenser ruthenus TaxID=7906 RepID=A0A662YST9_ACIRT|nr:Transcription initiation factor TFIID subunit 4 [Acipenser ruthenus]